MCNGQWMLLPPFTILSPTLSFPLPPPSLPPAIPYSLLPSPSTPSILNLCMLLTHLLGQEVHLVFVQALGSREQFNDGQDLQDIAGSMSQREFKQYHNT